MLSISIIRGCYEYEGGLFFMREMCHVFRLDFDT